MFRLFGLATCHKYGLWLDSNELNNKMDISSGILTDCFTSVFVRLQCVARDTTTVVTAFCISALLGAETSRFTFIQVFTFPRVILQDFSSRTRANSSLWTNTQSLLLKLKHVIKWEWNHFHKFQYSIYHIVWYEDMQKQLRFCASLNCNEWNKNIF